MRHTRTAALLALLTMFGSGCIGVVFSDPLGRKSALRLAQREYTKFVRWGDIEAAAGFVHPEIRQEFLDYEGRFEGIRVTDFDIGEVRYGEDLATANVRVTYHAYSLANMVEREIKETQQWERLGGNQWAVRPELEGIVDQVNKVEN